MQPEDIDFPISDTFAGGLAELHGWPVPLRCETLREARAREDSEQIKAAKNEMSEHMLNDKESLIQIWNRVRGLEKQNQYLLNELKGGKAHLPKQSQPRPSRGIEGL